MIALDCIYDEFVTPIKNRRDSMAQIITPKQEEVIAAQHDALALQQAEDQMNGARLCEGLPPIFSLLDKDRRDSMTCTENSEARQAKPAAASTRRALLLQAADTIDGDRNDTYGGPESSFRTIAGMWNEYLMACAVGVPGGILQPHDVAAMLALLKIARIAGSGGTHKDSWLDLAGYAACGWETVAVPVPADMTPAKVKIDALEKIQEELRGMQPIGPGTVGWQGVK